jgi:signal transduction histidine kinase
MGLRIMRHRAALIGASVRFLRNPGGGTLVRCSLPLSD